MVAKCKWDDVKARFHEIEKWLKQGLAEYQIFKNLGVGRTTWESYKKKHPELMELLKKGRESQISEVENSLFKQATGYYYHVDEVIKVKDSDGERIEKVRVQKFKGPETAAIIFFLKNKSKFEWCDNPQMVDIKRQELEIRKAESEFKAW